MLHGEWRPPPGVKACTFERCKGIMALNDIHILFFNGVATSVRTTLRLSFGERLTIAVPRTRSVFEPQVKPPSLFLGFAASTSVPLPLGRQLCGQDPAEHSPRVRLRFTRQRATFRHANKDRPFEQVATIQTEGNRRCGS